MANIFSIISVVCFIIAAISFMGAVILFFVMNSKAAYMELKGKPQRESVGVNRENKEITILETPTRKIDMEDDAATTILYPKLERRAKDV